MKCELCKDKEATIHLTQVVEGMVKKIHLCETCAAASGFDVHGPMSITDILLGLGESGAKAKPSIKSVERSCPQCHLRRVDFKKTGRLGCPSCYATFADELAPVIRAMHRHEQHKGKIPERQRNTVEQSEAVAALKNDLEAAINEERFEDAARLRDELNALRARADN